MSSELQQFFSLDAPALFSALCASLSCALLGNFLLLRKQSLLGDAISHSVLPGIVFAFLITFSRTSLPVFLGAFAAGLVAVVLIEMIRVFTSVESSAAMGVVFSLFFALGVVLIETAAARNVDLDADCLLHGQMETIFFVAPNSMSELMSFATLAQLPSEVTIAFAVLLLTLVFLKVFFKELVLTSFDPAMALNLGLSPLRVHLLLMACVAAAVVASFEIVGSILVVAMMICPAAIARLYTDRLKQQIFLSCIFAASTVLLGYALATRFYEIFGVDVSMNSAGMIATVSGFFLMVSVVFAPKYGILGRRVRVLRLKIRVCREDILALLYRNEEECGKGAVFTKESLNAITREMNLMVRLVLYVLSKQRLVVLSNAGAISLTDSGRTQGLELVRNHRLWELYLVYRAGLEPDHVHLSAEHLEHFSKEAVGGELAAKGIKMDRDPHGKEIP